MSDRANGFASAQAAHEAREDCREYICENCNGFFEDFQAADYTLCPSCWDDEVEAREESFARDKELPVLW